MARKAVRADPYIDRRGGCGRTDSRLRTLSHPSSRRQFARPLAGELLRPPLPEEVLNLLRMSRLCNLCTTSEDGIPHLSLMNFTYSVGKLSHAHAYTMPRTDGLWRRV
jgi:hypothetical protein